MSIVKNAEGMFNIKLIKTFFTIIKVKKDIKQVKIGEKKKKNIYISYF